MSGSDLNRRARRLGVILALGCAALAPGAAGQGEIAPPAGQLPGGASSLREAFQDWQVDCSVANGTRTCILSQQQRQRESGQLVLAVELSRAGADALAGTLVMPFGLRLADGTTLQVDDNSASAPLPFSTCIPVGCLVPASFDVAALARLREGTTLKVLAAADDNGQPVALSVSLLGFSAALDRLRALDAQ